MIWEGRTVTAGYRRWWLSEITVKQKSGWLNLMFGILSCVIGELVKRNTSPVTQKTAPWTLLVDKFPSSCKSWPHRRSALRGGCDLAGRAGHLLNQRFGGLILGCSSLHVEVSLGQDTESLAAPGAFMGVWMCVWMGEWDMLYKLL